jgi:biopolymer transport protein ExbD
MAGIDVSAGDRTGRKALDSQINMIPMIDLLMVTISFLLLTAVWTHMARIDADAQVPGPKAATAPAEIEKQLHVEMRAPDRFVLRWKVGQTTIETIDVPRRDVVVDRGAVRVVAFPDLATKIGDEWKLKGQHTSAADLRRDQAVLHVDDRTEFKYLVGVMDAVRATHRSAQVGAKLESVPAFEMALSVD